MKILKYILMSLMLMGTFSGCFLDDDNSFKSDFYYDVRTALDQSEESEPLEFTDTFDESSTFDDLL